MLVLFLSIAALLIAGLDASGSPKVEETFISNPNRPTAGRAGSSFRILPDDIMRDVVIRYLGTKSRGNLEQINEDNAALIRTVRAQQHPGGLHEIHRYFRDLIENTEITAEHIRNSFVWKRVDTQMVREFMDRPNALGAGSFAHNLGKSYLALKVIGQRSAGPKFMAFVFENGYLTENHYHDGTKWHRSYDRQRSRQWRYQNMHKIQRLFQKQIARFRFDDVQDVHSVMRRDVSVKSNMKLLKKLLEMGILLVILGLALSPLILMLLYAYLNSIYEFI